MTIRPVDFNGMVQRTQDVTTMKQNADNKPVYDQQALTTKLEKDTQQNLKQVNEGEKSQEHQKKYDAREKGSNEYQGNQKKNQKKKEKIDGKVIPKTTMGGFDMKI